MSQHTPGPWHYDAETETIRVKQWMDNPLMGDCRGCIIADFEQAHGGKYRRDSVRGLKGTIEANARLVAAAPTLKEALEEVDAGLQFYMERHGEYDNRLSALRGIIADALAKATTAG